MAAGIVNLPPIEKYATYDVTIKLTDKTTGVPIDFTGCSADMMIRANFSGSTIAELSTSNGNITISAPTTGAINLIFTPTLTGALNPGTYIYDLLVTFPSGIVTRFIQGGINVNDGVTHV